MKMNLLLVLIFSLTPVLSLAQKSDGNDSAADAQEREKAKKRLYPGGRDEEPLQVQSQLANPSKGVVDDPEPPDQD